MDGVKSRGKNESIRSAEAYGEWSDWAWSQERQCFWRARKRAEDDDNFEYEYRETTGQIGSIPRTAETPWYAAGSNREQSPHIRVGINESTYYSHNHTYTSAYNSADAQMFTDEGEGSSTSRHDPHQNNQSFGGGTTYPVPATYPDSPTYHASTGSGEGYGPRATSYSASARYDDGYDEVDDPLRGLSPTDPNHGSWDTPSEEVAMEQPRSSPIVHAEPVKYKDRFGSIFGVSNDNSSTPGESLLEVALSKCSAPGRFDTIRYDLAWELPSYLKKNFPAEQPLGNILVLTGGTVDAYSSSCKDYLENIFPDVGPCVLDCLEKMLQDSEIVVGKEYSLKPATADIDLIAWSRSTLPYSSDGDASCASCIVSASYETHTQVALVLSWLCAAVRSSDLDGLSKSSISVAGKMKRSGKGCNRISIQLAPLDPVKPNGTCWHTLFPHGIIAKDFPIPLRRSGEGLEIPFADMALVCGCLGFVEYKKGLVVDGLNSILIPRKRLWEDDAFQWHFESKIREEGRVSYTSEVLESMDMAPWYPNGTGAVLPGELYNRRCFLAWAEKGTVVVGTEKHFNSTTIGDSHANLSASMKYVAAYGLNLGGNVSHLTFGATINLTPTSMPAFFKPSVSNGIRDILTIEANSSKSNHFNLVYDTDARIGWFLPQACLVLHMAHHYLSEQKFDLVDDKNEQIALEFTGDEHDCDVGAAAATILLRNLGYRTRRRGIATSAPARTGVTGSCDSKTPTTTNYEYCDFKDTVERLWYLLDTVGSTLQMNRSEYMKCSENTPQGIHGVDFKELLAAKGPEKGTTIRYVKFVKVDQPWSYLTHHQSTVVFCKDFGQAIVPVPEGLCDAWSEVPQKKDFLAVTGQTLRYLLKRHRSGLSKELKWLQKKPLIQRHNQSENSSVIHTQLLIGKVGAILSKIKDKISWSNPEEDLTNLELINAISPQSCFLFSARQGKECTDPVHDAQAERVVRPADLTSASLYAPEDAQRIKLLGLQNQGESDSALAGEGTMSLTALGKQPAVTSLSSESSRNGDLSELKQNAGPRTGQESAKVYNFFDSGNRPRRAVFTLPLDAPEDDDQKTLALKLQRAFKQEDSEDESPNGIPESGQRGDTVKSSGS